MFLKMRQEKSFNSSTSSPHRNVLHETSDYTTHTVVCSLVGTFGFQDRQKFCKAEFVPTGTDDRLASASIVSSTSKLNKSVRILAHIVRNRDLANY
jgi:hypothetical protein